MARERKGKGASSNKVLEAFVLQSMDHDAYFRLLMESKHGCICFREIAVNEYEPTNCANSPRLPKIFPHFHSRVRRSSFIEPQDPPLRCEPYPTSPSHSLTTTFEAVC